MAIFTNLSPVSKLSLFFIFILIIITGLLRLFVLENINYQLHHLYYGTSSSSMHSSLSFLRSFSYDALIKVKWLLTCAFTVTFYIYARWALNIIFRKGVHIKALNYTYISLIVLAFLFYFLDGVIGELGAGYKVSRFVIGIAQSPLPLVVLIPIFTLVNQD